MYMVLAPETGGETLFASSATAFEKLDDDTKRLVLDLQTINAPGSDIMDTLRLTVDGTRREDDIFVRCAWRRRPQN